MVLLCLPFLCAFQVGPWQAKRSFLEPGFPEYSFQEAVSAAASLKLSMPCRLKAPLQGHYWHASYPEALLTLTLHLSGKDTQAIRPRALWPPLLGEEVSWHDLKA